MQKEATTTMYLRIPPKLHEAVERAARQREMTVNHYVRILLEASVKRPSEVQGALAK